MANKQKNKADFLVNGQPSYAKEVDANQKAVGYNLGRAEANLQQQQRELLQQQQLMQVQTMMMMQQEDELRKMKQEIADSIQQMAMPAGIPPDMLAQQAMASGAPPPMMEDPMGMPPDAMGGMPPDMAGGGLPPEAMGMPSGMM